MCSDSCMSVRASWLRPWSACEIAEAHEARHPGFGYHQTCPQCRFYKRAQSWMGAYGTVPAPGHGFDSAQWLDERPSRWGVGALGTGLHHLRSRNGSSSAAAGREQRCFDARDRRFLGARESEAAKWNRVDAVRSSMQVADERARARAHFHGAAQARHGVLHGTARTCADQDSEYGRRRDALDGSGAAAMRLAPRVAVLHESIILGGERKPGMHGKLHQSDQVTRT